MADLGEFSPPPAPDSEAYAAVNAAMASTPRGRGFGRLADIAAFMAACQGAVPATPLRQARVVIFALDDHETTVATVEEITAGGAPVNTLARAHEASVRVIDDTNMPEESAVDEIVDAALQLGRDIADQEIDAGADLLIPAVAADSASITAAIVLGAITRTEPVALVNPTAHLSVSEWQRAVTSIRDGMFSGRRFSHQPLEFVRHCANLDVAVLDAAAVIGFISQATLRRTPVLIDGSLSAVCALVVERKAPGSAQWLIAGQLSAEPAFAIAMQKLGTTPLLAFDMDSACGCGAVLSLPLVNSAVELVADEIYAITEAINAGSEPGSESPSGANSHTQSES